MTPRKGPLCLKPLSSTDHLFRASGARVETTLGYISQVLGNLKNYTDGESSNSVLERLSDIQHSQDAILSQVSDANAVLHKIPALSRSALCSTPTTILETSQQFFPERYTVESQIPSSCLITLGGYEVRSSGDVTINAYRLLYHKSPRQWQCLMIFIEVHRCSKYWAAIKMARAARKWSNPVLCLAALVPHSLLTHLATLLCEGRNSRDPQPICFSLSDEVTFERNPPDTCLGMTLGIPSQRNRSWDAVGYVDDLGCPRYVESQVIQLEIIDQPSRFRSCINGILVYEVKCMDTPPSVEYLYSIRVLHCMKGASGFARLVGVVTDDEGKDLKSYLIEFPRARYNILHLAADTSISWERREKWAFQLIQGVSRMHEQGFVVGGLTMFTIPLILDRTDSVLFWVFREKIVPRRKIGAYYPPEFCHVRDMSAVMDEADRPYVTSKMDIFHLGLLLWLLAENKPITRASPVCMRKGCDLRGEEACDLSHVEPIALPQLPESIPRYYRDIVNSCRADQPRDRPAARDFLQKFPTVSGTLYQTQIREPYASGSSTFGWGLQIGKVTCSLCWKRPNYQQLPVFHCNVCNVGDFDLCQACFEGGAHCRDDTHLLVELGKIGSWVLPLRYHSCVKSSGDREIIDL